ncbi:MAG: hypothetical protein L6R45_27140 [Anaerolineae bacterium]|nr:hypothetical protein [Anaerolineae bacterium]
METSIDTLATGSRPAMKSPDYLRQRPINRAKAGLTRRCRRCSPGIHAGAGRSNKRGQIIRPALWYYHKLFSCLAAFILR